VEPDGLRGVLERLRQVRARGRRVRLGVAGRQIPAVLQILDVHLLVHQSQDALPVRQILPVRWGSCVSDALDGVFPETSGDGFPERQEPVDVDVQRSDGCAVLHQVRVLEPCRWDGVRSAA
jgi:hypothetical protein